MSATLSTSPDPQPLRCFIVEDRPVILQNLIATLQELLPLEVLGTAADEAQAVQWLEGLKGQPCDLMIIDIFLNTGSGLGVLKHARQVLPHASLTVLSNYATPDIRRRCEALGADKIFDKSAELEEFLAYCQELSDTLNAA